MSLNQICMVKVGGFCWNDDKVFVDFQRNLWSLLEFDLSITSWGMNSITIWANQMKTCKQIAGKKKWNSSFATRNADEACC